MKATKGKGLLLALLLWGSLLPGAWAAGSTASEKTQLQLSRRFPRRMPQLTIWKLPSLWRNPVPPGRGT